MLSNQSDPSDVVTISVSFDSMSLGTEPSRTSNESHDHESRGQFGYGGYRNNQYGEVHEQMELMVIISLNKSMTNHLLQLILTTPHRRNSKDLTRDL